MFGFFFPFIGFLLSWSFGGMGFMDFAWIVVVWISLLFDPLY